MAATQERRIELGALKVSVVLCLFAHFMTWEQDALNGNISKYFFSFGSDTWYKSSIFVASFINHCFMKDSSRSFNYYFLIKDSSRSGQHDSAKLGSAGYRQRWHAVSNTINISWTFHTFDGSQIFNFNMAVLHMECFANRRIRLKINLAAYVALKLFSVSKTKVNT